jgi:hypothetical protein
MFRPLESKAKTERTLVLDSPPGTSTYDRVIENNSIIVNLYIE